MTCGAAWYHPPFRFTAGHWVAACAGIALLGLLGYAGSINYPTLALDDPGLVWNNPFLKDPGPKKLQEVWTRPYMNDYIPLTHASYVVSALLFGHQGGGYRAGNVLFHIGCAFLLLFLVVRITDSEPLGFVVAALWVVHPLNVESVVWISSRKNTVSLLFMLASLLLLVRHLESGKGWELALCWLWGVCALLAKAHAVALAALLLGADLVLTPLLRPADRPAGPWRVLRHALPVAACLVYGYLAARVFHRDRPDQWLGFKWYASWLTGVAILGKYLWHSLVPVGMTIYPYVPVHGGFFRRITQVAPQPEPHPAGSEFSLEVVLGGLAALLAVLPPLLLAPRGWRRIVGFFCAWAVIMMLPALNLLRQPWSMGYRYTYFSLPGLIAAWVVMLGTRLPFLERVPFLGRVWRLGVRWRQEFLFAVGVALAVVLCGLTWYETRFWRTEISLAERAVQVAPDSAIAHYGLGEARLGEDAEGQMPDSVCLPYREALGCKDEYWTMGAGRRTRCEFFAAVYHDRHQEPEKARELCRRNVERYPAHVPAHYFMGMIEHRQKRWPAAVESLERVVSELRAADPTAGKLDPKDLPIITEKCDMSEWEICNSYLCLAQSHRELKQFEKAGALLDEAGRLFPREEQVVEAKKQLSAAKKEAAAGKKTPAAKEIVPPPGKPGACRPPPPAGPKGIGSLAACGRLSWRGTTRKG